MRITFIVPSVGKKPGVPYVKGWLMQPLSVAVLASLVPKGHDIKFYDDRLDRP